MYTVQTAKIYIDNVWSDLSPTLTVKEMLSLSRYILISLEDASGSIWLVTITQLEMITDPNIHIEDIPTTIELIELEEDFIITNSTTRDLSFAEVTDISSTTPNYGFIITDVGIAREQQNDIRRLKFEMNSKNSYTLGVLETGLPCSVIDLSLSELSSEHVLLPRSFDINKTLMVFGDSLILASNLFYDVGDRYLPKVGFDSWFLNLYLDNLRRIPPNAVGLFKERLLSNEIVSVDTVNKILTHPAVYFVEYETDYPFGDSRTIINDEYVDELNYSLVMHNNKPSNNRVLHVLNMLMIRRELKEINLKSYDRDVSDQAVSYEKIKIASDGYLYNLTYPKITRKI